MKRTNVFLNEEVIGTVQISKEGLYYRFRCQCSLPQAGMYRLIVSNANIQMDLGICIPQGTCFVLDRKVAIKHLGDGKLNFHVVLKTNPVGDRFIPVCSDKRFNYITELKHASYQIRDGNPGILIPKKATD